MTITPKPTTVVELFEGHPERWMKNQMNNGSIYNPPTCFCLLGAINFVYNRADNYELNRSVRQKLRDIFDWNPHSEYSSYISWQDAPERTFEEVLAKCKELGI